MGKRAKGDPALETTVGDRKRAPRREGRSRRCLALTIAHHPDLSRVGERHLTEPGGSIALSRLEPAFSAPYGGAPQALEAPQVSRKPLRLHGGPDGLRVERGMHAGPVHIDGVPLGERHCIERAALAAGVTMRLGGHVVLLVHDHALAAPESLPDATLAPALVGASVALDRVRARIARIAQHDIAVLLRGESGTGKELVAAAIHAAGPRAAAPFVSVNLAAIPPSTAAAALFGHVRGAFTGAGQAADGFFAAAEGGTLFLDEVAEAPDEVQTALLRALETGEIQPVGASRTRRVDVRLIAATDADLEGRVDEGRLRLPLVMRLSGYELRLPRLRERRDDIPRLLLHFVKAELARIGRQAVLEDDDPPWLPAEVTEVCLDHRWNGNVRELRNFARQIVIDWADADEVGLEAVAALAPAPRPPEAEANTHRGAHGAPRVSWAAEPGELTEAVARAALARNGHRPGPAAADLGVARSTLYAFIARSPNLHVASELTEEQITRALDAHDGNVERAGSALSVSERALRLRMKALGMKARA